MQTKQFEQSEHFTHLSTFQYFYQLFQLIVVVPNEKVGGWGLGGHGCSTGLKSGALAAHWLSYF